VARRFVVVAVVAVVAHFAPSAQAPAMHARIGLARLQTRAVCAWVETLHALRGDEPPPCGA
jgi:hypothetical protein